MTAAVLHLGLTGGIGSGKSTVAALLAELGATVLDADAIARSVTAAGGAAIAAITQAFGAQLIGPDGAMDRAAMRALVFTDPSAKARLEAIVHPHVAQANQAAVARGVAGGARWFVHDVPLLVESGRHRPRLSQVCVVDCSEATQIARVQRRSGLSEDAVLAVIAAQATRAQRLAAADAVISNEGIGLDELKAAVRMLAKRCQWV